MIVKNPNDYKFIKFEKSKSKHKKYNAIIFNTKTKRFKRVPFGAIKPNGVPHSQYRDDTNLSLYSAYDHLNKKRRDRYYARHGKKAKKYSSKWFSHKFLWP